MKASTRAGLFLPLLACLGFTAAHAAGQPKEATEITKALHKKAYETLPDKSGALAGTRDLKNARQGMYEKLPLPAIVSQDGARTVWDLSRHAFLTDLDKKAPSTVHPSLWRQSQLVMQSVLFKLRDRLYQVRNFDISNMTIIEGDTGLNIIDP